MSTKKPSKRLTAFCIALVCAFGASSLSHAETYYKWRDDSGVWHYGAIPPHGVEAIAVQTTGAGKRSTSKSQEPALGQAENTDEGAAAQTSEYFVEKPAPVPQKERQRLCKAAKANLETLNSKAVIRKRDADGNVAVISDKERQNEIDNAKQTIEDFC